ncbi:MAG: quinone-interacting membrane-bound oxidoreductase complex subunit QmoC [Ignavibacteriae bacterium]|nr:quinone-interacting membrane-bound oxidoreductase complex subunit QmoC [Ignavibacteriota bacterium]
MDERAVIGTDIEFIRHLKKHGGETMKKCFQCATCSVACELSPKEYSFPRKEMINASWGLKEKLMADPDIWLCHGCMDCSQMCPRGARPADVMGAVRSYIYRNFSKPKFMGKLLSEPKYLFVLFLIPVIIIAGLVIITNVIAHSGDMNLFTVREGVIKYEDFIHKLSIEALFIPGNILIFFLAGAGLVSYWKEMKNNLSVKPVKSFIKSAWEVLWNFLSHKKFEKCPTNSNRHYGHMYAFYGFIGTMIATGLVVVGEVYHYGHKFNLDFLTAVSFYLPYPMGLMHPVKILGLVSGVFLIIGLLIMFLKRTNQLEREGKNTYNDWLFLSVILGVGITGILSVFIRMSVDANTVWLAYTNYFIHLVLVFFLLWYMPFSKFAHMPYRFLGLTFLKMYGRENKQEFFNRN